MSPLESKRILRTNTKLTKRQNKSACTEHKTPRERVEKEKESCLLFRQPRRGKPTTLEGGKKIKHLWKKNILFPQYALCLLFVCHPGQKFVPRQGILCSELFLIAFQAFTFHSGGCCQIFFTPSSTVCYIRKDDQCRVKIDTVLLTSQNT